MGMVMGYGMVWHDMCGIVWPWFGMAWYGAQFFGTCLEFGVQSKYIHAFTTFSTLWVKQNIVCGEEDPIR